MGDSGKRSSRSLAPAGPFGTLPARPPRVRLSLSEFLAPRTLRDIPGSLNFRTSLSLLSLSDWNHETLRGRNIPRRGDRVSRALESRDSGRRVECEMNTSSSKLWLWLGNYAHGRRGGRGMKDQASLKFIETRKSESAKIISRSLRNRFAGRTRASSGARASTVS